MGGAIASCCKKPDNPDDKNIITNNYFLFPESNKNNNIRKNRFLMKNHSLDINNIIISDERTQQKDDISKINNSITSTRNFDREKIIKIQKNYHTHYLYNKFIKKIKPSIEKKTTNYINNIYNQCSFGEKITTNNDSFSEEGWKKYYSSDDPFFLYSKGNVFSNQIRLKNVDNPEFIEIYEGEMNYENQRHGFGILTTPYYVLKGEWRKGEFTGWGRKYFRNGDILEGKFIDGEINGKGNFKNKNKDTIYIGDFFKGEKWGKGELITEKYHYKGDFKNDKLHGYGIIDFLIEGQTYEGNFENNEINGKGVYKWKNGDIYEGDMKNGKMNGNGKYIYFDGKIYEGQYINGIKEGKGKLLYPDGKCFEGDFKNGYPHGEGLYTKNGNTRKVLFNQGKYIKTIS